MKKIYFTLIGTIVLGVVGYVVYINYIKPKASQNIEPDTNNGGGGAGVRSLNNDIPQTNIPQTEQVAHTKPLYVNTLQKPKLANQSLLTVSVKKNAPLSNFKGINI